MGRADPHHRFISHRAVDGAGDADWFAVDVHHLATGLEFIRKKRFPRVSFCRGPDAKGDPILDLQVLSELPFLEGLDLCCRIAKPAGLSALYSLHALRALWLRTALPVLDMQHFPQLQLLLLGGNKFCGGRHLTKLRKITIVDYTNELSAELRSIPNLTDIELRGCKAASLDGFDQYPAVQSITISYPQMLARLDEVAANRTLKRFSLERPSGLSLRDLSALGRSGTIEEIWVLQKEISSCAFVRDMGRLRSFYCNATVCDNDLQPILDLKTLEDVRINPMKKSYSPRITNAELNRMVKLPR